MRAPAMSTSTTRAVNSPDSANSRTSQSAKSVAFGSGSEIDNGCLREIGFEQAPEGSAALLKICCFELLEGAKNISLGRFSRFRRDAGEHSLGHRHKIGHRLPPGVTIARPPKGGSQA